MEKIQSREQVIVGIPLFNEKNTIAQVIFFSEKYADKVVVCDDGSSDLSDEIAERMGATVIHSPHFGYGSALKHLFNYAKNHSANVLVTIDSDGQHEPHDIPKLLEPLKEAKADIVIGSRFLEKTDIDKRRKAGIKVITSLTNKVAKSNFTDAQSGFRAYNRRAIEILNIFDDGYGASTEILMQAEKEGLKIVEVPTVMSHEDEKVGLKETRQGMSVVSSIVQNLIEEHPLKWFGLSGLVLLWIGLYFAAEAYQIYLRSGSVFSNTSLIAGFFLILSTFVEYTAITLYALSRLGKRLR